MYDVCKVIDIHREYVSELFVVISIILNSCYLHIYKKVICHTELSITKSNLFRVRLMKPCGVWFCRKELAKTVSVTLQQDPGYKEFALHTSIMELIHYLNIPPKLVSLPPSR